MSDRVIIYYKFEAGAGTSVINYAPRSELASREANLPMKRDPDESWTHGKYGSGGYDATNALPIDTGCRGEVTGNLTVASSSKPHAPLAAKAWSCSAILGVRARSSTAALPWGDALAGITLVSQLLAVDLTQKPLPIVLSNGIRTTTPFTKAGGATTAFKINRLWTSSGKGPTGNRSTTCAPVKFQS